MYNSSTLSPAQCQEKTRAILQRGGEWDVCDILDKGFDEDTAAVPQVIRAIDALCCTGEAHRCTTVNEAPKFSYN